MPIEAGGIGSPWSLELELQVVVSDLMWMPGTEHLTSPSSVIFSLGMNKLSVTIILRAHVRAGAELGDGEILPMCPCWL